MINTPPNVAEFAIGIFTRPPEPGRTKTRLIPALGAQGAADLHLRMLQQTLAACSETSAALTLWVTDSPQHAVFTQFAREFGCAIAVQQGADLGARMQHALAQMLHTQPRALVIGSDCLLHSAQSLQSAAAQLMQHDMVFTPAEDGGYVLVGARVVHPQAFAQIDWGTAQVMAQTRAALAQANIAWVEEPRLWDIDTPEDVERARSLGLL
ncbi:MAG: TIGR04282 family arsenosugar biosynthesis glycosyltransferase [Burkholderiaceae bacterium]